MVALVVLGAASLLGQGPKIPRTPQPVLVPAEAAWTVVLDALPSAGGVVDADRVYLPLQSQKVIALGRSDGAVAWTREIESTTAPVARAGMVYVMARDEIQALDASTGLERWRAPLEHPPIVPLSFAGDRLFFAIAPSTLVALSPTDGSIFWQRQLPSPPMHPVVGHDSRVYVALGDGMVAGLSASDGSTLWQRRIHERLALPALVGDRLIVGSATNEVFALNAASGTILWRWRLGGDVVGAAGAGDIVFIAALDNVLRAVRANGNQRWKKPLSSRPALPPQTVGDLVIVTGTSPAISVYDGMDGTLIGTYVAPAELEGPPLVLPGGSSAVGMVVITRDGRVLGLRPKPPEPPAAPAGRRGAPPPALPPGTGAPAAAPPVPIPTP